MSDNKPIAKANTTSQPGKTAVVVQGKPTIQVIYRFFPAEHTAALDLKLAGHGPSNNLAGLAYVVGKVTGNALEPFSTQIQLAPNGSKLEGTLANGVFKPSTAAQIKSREEAIAALKAKKVPKQEIEAGKRKLAAEFGALVSAHKILIAKRIEAGTTVGLCINVDAKKKFRKYPLWQVTAGDNDIVVDVFETYGRHDLDDKAIKVETREEGTKDHPHPVDYYKAQLSGNVWMRSTHPFTEADVDALPADAATAAMKAALKKIYTNDFVNVGPDFAIDVPRQTDEKDKASTRLQWIANENENCTANIKGLNLRAEVPRRIHPAAYAAAAKAAHESGATAVKFTSSWRPMLGRMPHRQGRGLDLKWLAEGSNALQLNRAALGNKSVADKNHDGIVDGTNISVDEQQAFNDWQSAKSASDAAETTFGHTKTDLLAKTKNLANAKKTGNADKIEKAQHEVDEADKAAAEAKKASEKATKVKDSKHEEWTKQLAQHEPGILGRYRRYVMKEECITQVIDPWYVDFKAHDGQAPQPNEQRPGDEKLHNNHMHLSISDKELHE